MSLCSSAPTNRRKVALEETQVHQAALEESHARRTMILRQAALADAQVHQAALKEAQACRIMSLRKVALEEAQTKATASSRSERFN